MVFQDSFGACSLIYYLQPLVRTRVPAALATYMVPLLSVAFITQCLSDVKQLVLVLNVGK